MDETPASPGVTELLVSWSSGNQGAGEELFPLVYDELRRIAGYYLSQETRGHTLQPTALVHEAYLRLIDQRRVDWRNRAHFIGVAAIMMRRVLVNHARDRAAAKRGGAAERVSLTDVLETLEQPQIDVIALHEALDRLDALDPRKARIVELKFFGGLTTAEISEVMQMSPATIDRDWSFARAWLYDAMTTTDERASS